MKIKSVFEKYLSNTPKYANQIQIQIFHLVVFQIQIQIQIQIFAYLNTNTNTNTYLTPALPKVTEMGAKIFFHTHRLTTCGLKKLASGVFPERWKVLAEQRRRRRQKRTKNNKSPGYPGWLNDDPCRSLTHYAPLKGDHARRWVDISVLSTVNGYLVTFTKLTTWNIYFFQSLVCCVVLLHFGLTHCGIVTPYSDRDLGQHCLR